MEHKELFRLEFGPQKNGAIGRLIKKADALLLEWKGDVLFCEYLLILNKSFEAVVQYNLSAWIADTTALSRPEEEMSKHLTEMFPKMAVEAGVTKFAVITPAAHEVFAKKTVEKIETNKALGKTDTLESFYAASLNEVFDRIKS